MLWFCVKIYDFALVELLTCLVLRLRLAILAGARDFCSAVGEHWPDGVFSIVTTPESRHQWLLA